MKKEKWAPTITETISRGIDLEGSIDSVIESLTRIRDANADKYTKIYIESEIHHGFYDDSDMSVSYSVVGNRPETQEECEKRLAAQIEFKKLQEKKELELYLKLKAKQESLEALKAKQESLEAKKANKKVKK